MHSPLCTGTVLPIGNAQLRSTGAIARPTTYSQDRGFTVARALREGVKVHDLASVAPRSTATLSEWRASHSEFAILWLLSKSARIYARAAERARRDLDYRGLLIQRFEESRRELAERDPKAAKLWGRGEDLVEGLDSAREELDAVLYAGPNEREAAWELFLAEGEGAHYSAAEILYPALAPGDSPLAALTNANAWAEALAWARSMEEANRGL